MKTKKGLKDLIVGIIIVNRTPGEAADEIIKVLASEGNIKGIFDVNEN